MLKYSIFSALQMDRCLLPILLSFCKGEHAQRGLTLLLFCANIGNAKKAINERSLKTEQGESMFCVSGSLIRELYFE